MPTPSNASMCFLASQDCLPMWTNRVPPASMQYWEQMKVLLSSSEYSPMANQMLDSLINRIGLSVVRDMLVVNKFEKFKTFQMNFGGVMQEMATDITAAQQYLGTQATGADRDQFAIFLPNAKAAYHRINREQYYPITVEDKWLKQAFIDAGGLAQFLGSIIMSLYNSNTVDEEVYNKQLILEFAAQTAFPLQDSQIVELPDIRQDTAPVSDIRLFVKKAKDLIGWLGNNARCYNAAGFMHASPKSQLHMLLDLQAMNQNEVQNLSGLFNPQYNTFGLPITELNNFGEAGGQLIGVIAENDWCMNMSNGISMTMSENARQKYYNRFLHVEEMYAATPFRNVVYLVANKEQFLADIKNVKIMGKAVKVEKD